MFMLVARRAFAQQGAMARFRGTIGTVNGRVVGVETATGQNVSVDVPADALVAVATSGSFGDIKPGSFIGSAARTLPDGTLEALEVHVFSEEMRGAGEGHRPWDLAPESTMTNGTVGKMIGAEGRRLTVSYPGGEQTLTVPPGAPIVRTSKGDWSDVKSGAPVVVTANQAADGKLTALYLVVGRDGVRPPM
jgi:hypothetical protein